MAFPGTAYQAPSRASYDVILVGGAMYGAAIAWFLADNPDFDGSVLVVEMDPSYQFSSTAHTNSCMRQQFSQALNVRISQFAADYVKNFPAYMGGDPRVPQPALQSYGYLYLADTPAFAAHLKAAQGVQAAAGAGTQHMAVGDIAQAYPFYNLEDILAGNHNRVDEGYFDGTTLFDWWRRLARERGVEFCTNRVVTMATNPSGTRVESLTLATGEVLACGQVGNTSGPRAVETSRMVGLEIPVEPRKRYTFIFAAQHPLDRDLPLTIDPSGVHMRSEGALYLAGCAPEEDTAVAYDDFEMDPEIWEAKVWPILAHRIPQFAALKLTRAWAGHYAFNVFDQNAIIGPHSRVRNFLFANGFSGHGFQQAPALGRGLAEWITYGEFRTLDLRPLSYDRIERGEPFTEAAVI